LHYPGNEEIDREMSRWAVALLVMAGVGSASAQMATVREEAQIYGRPGWIIETGTMRIAVLRGGGHIAEVRWLSNNPRLSINPMFVPVGTGYMGHMVYFPHFGPASAEEREQGLRGHGEANSVDWQQTRAPHITSEGVTFFYGAELPRTQYRIERAVTLNTGESAVHVQEWVENLASYDRPYNWDQHATFGAPFVAPGKNMLDMPGTRGMTDPKRTAGGKWAESSLFQWPQAPTKEDSRVSLREFAAVPAGQVYTPVLADSSRPQSWFAMYNTDYPLLVTYVFPASDNPWIVDWQNQPRTDSPAGTARGIEFGTSPWDEGLRKSVERGQLMGVPTYRFIGARERRSTTFSIYLSEIRPGFAGVRDVRLEGKNLVVVERQ
jgi:Domain of unknown function (DUF4432)